MENFLLINRKSPACKSAEEAFGKYFPGSKGHMRVAGENILFLYNKGDRFPENLFEMDGSFIGTFGTPVYKKFSYAEGLRNMLKDDLSGNFDQADLLGHYYIFIWNGSQLKVFNDGSRILNVYSLAGEQCICSSFLTLTEISPHPFTLNRLAVNEIIFTGGLTGDETILNEIKLFNPANGSKPGGIKIQSPVININDEPRSRKEAFDKQISILENYFLSVKNLADEFGADCGLTGGLDSRLMLGLVMKYFSKFQVHSHFRTTKNTDLEIATEIAGRMQIPFVSPEVIPWERKSEEEKRETFLNAFRYCDGQIREHCYWTEDYTSTGYRASVTNGSGLGLQGIGGEQYRNVDRMMVKSYDFGEWIRFKHIAKFSYNKILNQPVGKELSAHIKNKISGALFQGTIKKRLTLIDIKRIANEVIIPSYRGIKTSCDNRILFALSPFADFKIAQSAYSVIPFLDLTYDLEIDLLKYFAPELAAIRSTYGFAFSTKEPFLSYAVPGIIYNFIPSRVTLEILRKYKSLTKKRNRGPVIRNESFLNGCLNSLKETGIVADIENYLADIRVSNMIYSLGFIVGELKSKLK